MRVFVVDIRSCVTKNSIGQNVVVRKTYPNTSSNRHGLNALDSAIPLRIPSVNEWQVLGSNLSSMSDVAYQYIPSCLFAISMT